MYVFHFYVYYNCDWDKMRRFTIAYYLMLVFVFALKCNNALKGIALKCIAWESVGAETISLKQIVRNCNALKCTVTVAWHGYPTNHYQ